MNQLEVQSKPPRKLKGRIVVVESIYHQPADDQPKVVDNSYMQQIDSEEQPYGPRKMVVGEEWAPLDLGWIKEASLMAIKNEEGRFMQVIPTEAQIKEAEEKVLELGVAVGDGVVFRVAELSIQQSLRFPPISLISYRIRCCKGTGRYSISLFPK